MTTEDRANLTAAEMGIMDEIEIAMEAVNAAKGCLREAALKMSGRLPGEGAMRNIDEQDAFVIAHLMGSMTMTIMTLKALEESTVAFLGTETEEGGGDDEE